MSDRSHARRMSRRSFFGAACAAALATQAHAGLTLLGTGAQGSGPALAAVQALTLLGPTSSAILDPRGTGPYGYQGNGVVMQMDFICTSTLSICPIDVSKIHITGFSQGYNNNGGAGPISSTTRIFTGNPIELLRRQPQSGNLALSQTQQLFRQSGAVVNNPTIGTTVSVFLVMPWQGFAPDTFSVAFDAGWNGGGSTAGAGPTVTNSSTLDSTLDDAPLFGFFHTPCTRTASNTLNIELQVAGHSAGWLGGASNIQMVAGVDLWASDGTTTGAVTQVTSVALSSVQTLNGKAEVFKAALNISAIADTDGSDNIGPGIAFVDGTIYRWRGKPYNIRNDGVAWTTRTTGTPQPCTIHPFVKDVGLKYGGGVAYVNPAGAGGSPQVFTGPAANAAAAAAGAYANPNTALLALQNYNNATTGRAAGAILHQSAQGGQLHLLNLTGSAASTELTGTWAPVATGNCMVEVLQSPFNTAEAFYNASANRTCGNGMFRFTGVRINKNGGSLQFGDTTANSVASLVAFENFSVTWPVTTTTAWVQNVALCYLFNYNAISPIATNVAASALGQSSSGPYRAAKAIGVTWGDPTSFTGQFIPYHAVGVVGKLGNGSSPMEPSAVRQSTNDGFIVYNCQFLGFSDSIYSFGQAAWQFDRGFCVWQNVFEGTSNSGNNLGFQVGASAASNVKNGMWGFNTGAHDPADTNTSLQTDDRNGFSLGYRNATANLGSTIKLVVVANLTPRIAQKGARFTLDNAGGEGNVGGWTNRWGIDHWYNGELISRPDLGGTYGVPPVQRPLNNLNSSNAVFDWDIADYDASTGYGSASNLGIVTWVNNLCSSGGNGGGDYHLKDAASGGNNVGKGYVPPGKAWNRFDGGGAARKNAAGGATGLSGALGVFEATD